MSKINKILVALVGLLMIILIVILMLQNNFFKKNMSTLTNNTSAPLVTKIIRQPAVAGQFYPADKNELEKIIDEFLAMAMTTPITGEPQILIAPHAGYVFSGPTAAYAFKTVAEKKYDDVLVIGGSHNYPLAGLALYNGDMVLTPLGEVKVDKKINEELKNSNQKIYFDNQVHEPEHSLEVELPFLQKTLLPNWQVTLGLINDSDLETLNSIADSLYNLVQKNPKTLIVISSDLSHYPTYKDAIYSDTKIMNAIVSKNISSLDQTIAKIMSEKLPNLATCACGEAAIKIGMLLADKLNLSGQILKYQNSGDTKYGEKNRVVGYGAIAFLKTQKTINKTQKFLTEDEQLSALALARNTLELEFGLTKEKNKAYKNYPIFSEKRGMFVTLKKDGELRGCIGLIEPISELGTGIIEMAKAAAFDDPRFSALTKEELKNITLEISVLTVPQKISNPKKEIELGKHGVIVRSGLHSGVFLPQVATETGWDLNEFMSELCTQKAGLAPNCWLDGSADVYTFEAQVFEEK